MNAVQITSIEHTALYAHLDRSADEEPDALPFGVIGIDADGIVRRYNRFESQAAGEGQAAPVGCP